MKSNFKKQYWFDIWFDSPYYHLLYQHRDKDEAKEFITNLIQHLKLAPHSFLLDLACGKGRHSIYFAKNGFNVTGLDLSKQSIQYAQQFENDSLSFFTHDMRQPFRVNYFDAVMNLFTSFGYFENEKDNLKTVQSAAASLKPGGVMVIDFMNSTKVLHDLIPKEQKKVCDIAFKIQKKIENGFLIKQINFKDNGEDFSFTEKVKTLKLPDFISYFEKSGLRLTATFGNYDLQKFDEETSERLILLATKV